MRESNIKEKNTNATKKIICCNSKTRLLKQEKQKCKARCNIRE